MEIMLNKVNCFLHYSYIPDPKVSQPESLQRWLDGDLSIPDYSNAGKPELIKKGSQALRKCFLDEIANDNDKTHVIPLSGGLDSRAILVNLLELLDKSKIITVTFGIPGSPDYVSGRDIAKKAGVKWASIDLSPGTWKWKTESLIESAKRSERPTWIFDNTVNHAINLMFGKDHVFWSGFMGDSLGCIEPISKNTKTWEDAKTAFAQKSCIYKNKLTKNGFNPQECLPKQPFTDTSNLDYYSQLNHFIKQQCLTKHIYSPTGYDIRYPYLNTSWVEFLLSVPHHYNDRQYLYRKILQSSWPRFFSWNSTPYRDSSRLEKLLHGKGKIMIRNFIDKTLPGLTSGIPDKNRKYVDWDYALRTQDDLKYVVYSNIQDLKARKIIYWLDLNKLWASHHNLKINLAKELMTLAALEIHLKLKTIPSD